MTLVEETTVGATPNAACNSGSQSGAVPAAPLGRASNSSAQFPPRAPIAPTVAEMDPVYLITPTFEMARALSLRDKKPPHIIRLAGHNHFSTMCTFGTVDDSFSTPLTEWIRGL